MTEHQSSSSSSWLGALGRIFSGSGSSQSSNEKVESNRTSDNNTRNNSSFLNGSPSLKSNPSSGKGLRYLNATNADNRTPLDTSRPAPLADIISQPRKRQNDEFRAPAEQDISALGAKRFRGLANHSLLEEPIRVNISERLDATWNGIGAFDSSPSSMRSLKSRMSEVPSTTSSGLSSKTRAILQQLERVHTPAKESRKLPTMRTLGTTSEKWASIQSTTLSSVTGTPPPLKKTMGSVPSRIQLLSSRLGSVQRKPYWRDIVRAPKIHTDDSMSKIIPELNVINGGTKVHPLFDIDDHSPVKEKKKDLTETRKPQPVLKGSDGKGRNVFSAKDLEDDNLTPLPSVPSVSLPAFAAPAKGFLDDIVFSFAPPKENRFENGVLTPSDDNEDETSDSESSSVPDSEGSSSGSDSSTGVQSEQSDKKESRPPTSTDSESSATPFSSKSISPQNRDMEKKADDSSAKPSATVESNPIVTKPVEDVKAPSAPKAASTSWNCPDCFVSNKSSDDKCVCCGHQQKKEEEKRVDWDCPDCFVKNTAKLDKCQCCGYVKYKSAASTSSSSNVFGDKAFKPQSFGTSTGSTGFSFGVGGSSSSSAKPAFGFGSGPSSTPSTSTSNTSVTTSSAPSFGLSVQKSETTSTPSFGTGEKATASTAVAPAFGVAASKTAPSSTETSKPAFGGFSSNKPLFGSSTATVQPTPATIEPTKAPETSKSVFAFGGSADSSKVETTAKPVETVKPLFGAPSDTSKLLFGAPVSAATTVAPAIPTNPLLGSGSLAASKPLFGNSAATTSAEKPKISFGSAPEVPKSTEAPKLFGSSDTSKPLFGNSSSLSNAFGTSGTEPPKLGLFGQAATSTAPVASVAAIAPTSTAVPSFGAAPSSGTSNLFGGSGSLFGASASTDSSFAFKPSTSEEKKPLFGGSSDKTNLFSAASSSKDDLPAKRSFLGSGSNTTASALPFAFGSTSSTAPTATPAPAAPAATNLFSSNNSSQGFGMSSSTPSFGASVFGNEAPSVPSLSASSSTNSLFAGNTDMSKPFQFGVPAAPTGAQPFQFGQTSLGSSTFNFSGGAPAPAPAPALAFQSQPAAPVMFGGNSAEAPGGSFAFQGGAGGQTRKLATARRRMVKK